MNDPISDLQGKLRQFARERNWEQFHTPKNLAMALAVEVGELLEIFQWLTPDESADIMGRERGADVEDEIADVFVYLTRLADVLGVDLYEVALAKVARNQVRFPMSDGPEGEPTS